MQTSATGRPIRGFTLIELVVVVAILGLLTLPVVLRVGGGGVFGGATSAQAAQARLADDLTRMRDRALFTHEVLRLTPDRQGWQWSTRLPMTAAAPQPGFDLRRSGWAPDGDPVRLEGLSLIWQVDVPPGTDAAVHLMPDGRGTSFSVRLGAGGPLCRFDGWGDLACADR